MPTNPIHRVMGWALRGVRAGEAKLCFRRLGAPQLLSLTSSAFAQGGPIPPRYCGAGGDNVSPALDVTGVLAGTQGMALVVEDPDAPMSSPFVHALATWTASRGHELPENALLAGDERLGLVMGANTFGKSTYQGPAPVPNHGPHHYAFQVFALDIQLQLHTGFDLKTLEAAMMGRVLGCGVLTGLFERR